jgi:hypothetical protein
MAGQKWRDGGAHKFRDWLLTHRCLYFCGIAWRSAPSRIILYHSTTRLHEIAFCSCRTSSSTDRHKDGGTSTAHLRRHSYQQTEDPWFTSCKHTLTLPIFSVKFLGRQHMPGRYPKTVLAGYFGLLKYECTVRKTLGDE